MTVAMVRDHTSNQNKNKQQHHTATTTTTTTSSRTAKVFLFGCIALFVTVIVAVTKLSSFTTIIKDRVVEVKAKAGFLSAGFSYYDVSSSEEQQGEDASSKSPTSLWTNERVFQYERKITPNQDPKHVKNLLYTSRKREQSIAEFENGHVLIRYLSNVDDINNNSNSGGKTIYNLIIRVVINNNALNNNNNNNNKKDNIKKRWDTVLKQFKLPKSAPIRIQVEYVEYDHDHDGNSNYSSSFLRQLFRRHDDSNGDNNNNGDWVFVVQDTTYVNLKQLVLRLFADYVDAETIGMRGLLKKRWVNNKTKIKIPILEAGMLFTNKALKQVWESRSSSCFHEDTTTTTTSTVKSIISDWTTCIVTSSATSAANTTTTNNNALLQWKSLPGLNPYNSEEIVKFALDRTLFQQHDNDNDEIISHKTYKSVGGPIMGTATLPITYSNMGDDDLFYQQLNVDTYNGKVPKILHQIWSGPLSNISPEIRVAQKQCRKMHEDLGWKYMFWTDDKLSKLPGLPQLTSMTSDISKVKHYTDMIRLYLLHRYGGVYLDIDAICLRPFDPLLSYMEEQDGNGNSKDFLANFESERLLGRQIANGVFIAAPMSPVLSANALHIGIKLHTNPIWKIIPAFRITGPWPTTELKTDWYTWLDNHYTILSSSAFIPLYKDEGKGMSLDEYMDFARKKGSYTIQMYQSTKNKNSIQIIQQPNGNNNDDVDDNDDSSEMITSIDIDDDDGPDGHHHEFRYRNTSIPPQRPSVLMIVAHPDDETIWGGEYLLKEGHNVHVVVTCTQNSETDIRRNEFMAVSKRAGFLAEFLDGKDTMYPKPLLEPHIEKRIQHLICGDQVWDRIITHGPEGEYGHPQHQQVHDAVLFASRRCIDLYDKLYVFDPRPTNDNNKDNYVFSEAKASMASLHKSQKKVVFETFGKWSEQIVPIRQYDYATANNICKSNAVGHESRKCRLDKVLDKLKNNSTPAPSLANWLNVVVQQCKNHKSIPCHSYIYS